MITQLEWYAIKCEGKLAKLGEFKYGKFYIIKWLPEDTEKILFPLMVVKPFMSIQLQQVYPILSKFKGIRYNTRTTAISEDELVFRLYKDQIEYQALIPVKWFVNNKKSIYEVDSSNGLI